MSGSDDNTLKLWDAQSAGESQVTPRHTSYVNACAFSPDSRFIVSGASDGLKLWDVQTGKELMTFRGQTGVVQACAVSPDGRFIVSGGRDGSLRLWEPGSGSEVWTQAEYEVAFCAFSPDGRYVLSAGWMPGATTSSIKVRDAASGKEIATLVPQGENITAFALSPDGRQVIEGGSNARILRFWDIETGTEVRTLVAGYVTACAFSPDGRCVIAAAGSEGLTLWSLQTGGEVWTTRRKSTNPMSITEIARAHVEQPRFGLIRRITFTPDGRHVLTASDDATVRLFDAESGRELCRLALLGDVGALATHPQLRNAVCGDSSGNVYQIELVGIEYGPIIVTAVDLGQGAGFALRCPKCFRLHPLDDAWLGEVIECPTPDCGLSLRVNPFVMGIATGHRPAAPTNREPQEAVNLTTAPVTTPRPRHWWSRR